MEGKEKLRLILPTFILESSYRISVDRKGATNPQTQVMLKNMSLLVRIFDKSENFLKLVTS